MLNMPEEPLDVICLGRSSVDLYGEQIGGRLEDMQSFAKYVGGCPTNISVGTARLGLRSALITRVGDEHMGRFIRETVAAEGVDTRSVVTDPERLTALVILGVRDKETFPLIFYRTDCADMAISPDDFDPDFIASARAIVVSGTHFSTPGVERASRTAIAYAKAAGVKVVFDIDYRPVLWGLTGLGLGEERFVASDVVSDRLKTILPDCDLIVGTEEEIQIAGGKATTLESLRQIRALTDGILTVKLGAQGCRVLTGAIPETLDEGIRHDGFPVEVFNVLGAGDAFMSGFLSAWLRDMPLEECARRANACGALVVSRHGCAPAIPSARELEDFLATGSDHFRLREDRRLERLHRVTNRLQDWPEVCALAFDHRWQFEALAEQHGAEPGRIGAFKDLVAQGARQGAGGRAGAGVLIDGRFGDDALAAMTGTGWWVGRPVELPKADPLEFEDGPNIAATLRDWPREQVAKCLVSYHPDDPPARRAHQEDRLVRLYEACAQTGHEFLLEVIPDKDLASDSTTLSRALDLLYDRGIYPDWWKLPAPADDAAWAKIAQVIEARDPHCRGVLLLGLDAPEAEIRAGFERAAGHGICKGFAIGRTIFRETAERWFAGRIDDQAAIEEIAAAYRRILDLWRQVRPAPDA
jgi:5-dehydro-2-deoxygluconokinase